MKRFIVLHKKVGETPLMALHAWKDAHPAYAHTPASYAGRLDPMASGKLLVLLGDECKKQRAYTGLDKEYEIEVLLDIGSDTGDVLGMPELALEETAVSPTQLAQILLREHGGHTRAYPLFSSKTVEGKPLFLHALEGSASRIELPTHIEHIYRIQLLARTSITSSELRARVTRLLNLVPRTEEPSKRLGADFRVDQIRAEWESLFQSAPERHFTLLRLRVTCASGTYMRSLAGRIGAALGTRAFALSISRTKIGKTFPLLGNRRLWLRTY